MKGYVKSLKKDYRHWICIIITLISLGLGYFFPNSIPRLAESIRDLFTSILYYFAEIFAPNVNTVYPTVLQKQEWFFAPQIWEPIKFLPSSLEEFIVFWWDFCKQIFNIDHIKAYFSLIFDFIEFLSRFLLLLIPLLLLFYIEINNIKNKRCTERNKKSKPLLYFEFFLFHVLTPIGNWCKEFIYFCFNNSKYLISWFIIWCMHFNVFSIVISFVAYYLYFTSSWKIFTIYSQLLKLQTDLTPMIRFLPAIVWILIGIKIYNHICKSIAFDYLRYAQRCNEAVIRARGVVSIIAGKMRMGKTKLATSMALVTEKVIYDDMYDVMLKYERQFPNFSWQLFRDELDRLIYNRKIVDLDSCRETVQRMGKWFVYVSNRYSYAEYQYFIRKYRVKIDRTFEYDYDHYATKYNDNLRVTMLFRALEEYACAYWTFTIKTTLVFANYSIRDDSQLKSLGNKPYRDNDFLHRNPELRAMYSRYAHILDMDMLRLQTKMVEDNEYSRVLHPGAYVISEIDKERKNMLELKEIKMSTDEANQKNDGFNATLMMSGHANLVDYIPIIKFFGDLQRPENLGAGARELGEVIHIVEKSDTAPVLPFFSSYWFTQGMFEWFKGIWTSFKNEYDINRCDQTLFVYLIDNLVTKINNHYDKIHGLFGMQTLTLEIEDGTLEGETTREYWRSMSIFDLSERYSSDCLKGVFKSDKPNEKHIDDYVMYEGIMPTPEELGMQHSYFYNGVSKMKESEKDSA